MDVLAHHLTGIDLLARVDEEFAAILQLVDGVGEGRARFEGNHRAVHTPFDVALVGLIFLEPVRHDGFALRGREHVGSEADDATRGDVELDVRALALAFHRGHFALSARHHVNHLRGEFVGHVDGELFNGLAANAIHLLEYDLRLPHLQLVALAAHRFDEHREVQHASATDNPLVRSVFVGFHAQGEVLLQFLLQSVVDVARGDEFALFAEEGRVVDGEKHRHRGLVDGDGRQRLGIFHVANRVANLEFLKPDHGADVAAAHLFGAGVAHAVEGVQFLDFRFLERAVAMGNGHLLTVFQLAAMHAPHGNSPRVARIVEARNQHLRRAVELLGRGNHLHDFV